MNFSGIIEMDEIPAIQELLKDAKSFCCYGFDCYERYWDITDEEYLAQLETKREEITHEILERCRAVLVRRALEELQDHVHYYYRHRRSAAFCQMAAQTIDELKSAGLSGAQLAELAPDCGPESGKLSELALIFQGYETLLAGTGTVWRL